MTTHTVRSLCIGKWNLRKNQPQSIDVVVGDRTVYTYWPHARIGNGSEGVVYSYSKGCKYNFEPPAQQEQPPAEEWLQSLIPTHGKMPNFLAVKVFYEDAGGAALAEVGAASRIRRNPRLVRMRGLVSGVPLRRTRSSLSALCGRVQKPCRAAPPADIFEKVERRCLVMPMYGETLSGRCGEWRRAIDKGDQELADRVEHDCHSVIRQLLSVIVNLLDVGLHYVDLKSENVCIDNEGNGVVLCDLGGAFCPKLGDAGLCTYPPPEFPNGIITRPCSSVAGHTLGVLFFALLLGRDAVDPLLACNMKPPASTSPVFAAAEAPEQTFERGTLPELQHRCGAATPEQRRFFLRCTGIDLSSATFCPSAREPLSELLAPPRIDIATPSTPYRDEVSVPSVCISTCF